MISKTYDIAIIGAGMAGASLAAAIGSNARVILIEAESQPGYHATGRSAAFWSETYGGPAIQPLTSASRAALEPYLSPRGGIHIADAEGGGALAALASAFAGGSPRLDPVDRAGLERILPGLSPDFTRGLAEPSCSDIDVARLHADLLASTRRAGADIVTDAPVRALHKATSSWEITTPTISITSHIIVNAAGAWASELARMAGAAPIDVTPFRRTVAQLQVDPPARYDLPLIMDAAGRFYFKPDTGGRLWLSPHDETPCTAHDVAPEELDVAIAIDRFERAIDWRVVRRERAWAGLRSFAPDRAPVYGFDTRAPGFFWFAGQGGFGIQTAPAAAEIGAALLLDRALPEEMRKIDIGRYAPARFGP